MQIRKFYFLTLIFFLFPCIGFSSNTFLQNNNVRQFIQKMVQKHHFKKNYLLKIFKQVQMKPKVLQNIQAPAEQQPWYVYQQIFITPDRIAEGIKFWRQHAKLL